MEEFITKLFAAYGVRPLRLLPPQKGYRNTSYAADLADGRTVNLIVYKTEPASLELIRRTNEMADFVAGRRIPARRTYDKRILCLNATSAIKRYASLYEYLPGTTIPWEAYTKDHIKLLGMALSNLHHVAATYPTDTLPRVHEQYIQQLDRMLKYFNQEGVRDAMARKLGITPPFDASNQLLKLLGVCDKLPPQQALHMDFVRGNILFQPANTHAANHSVLTVGGVTISGILDFEKATYGHPLFDIARTLAFLLVDCKYKSEAQVRKYFLYSGYAKRGKAALPLLTLRYKNREIDLLERLTDLFLLHDLYKFLLHNPYESLFSNEHYRRTVQLCLRRGLTQSL